MIKLLSATIGMAFGFAIAGVSTMYLSWQMACGLWLLFGIVIIVPSAYTMGKDGTLTDADDVQVAGIFLALGVIAWPIVVIFILISETIKAGQRQRKIDSDTPAPNGDQRKEAQK